VKSRKLRLVFAAALAIGAAAIAQGCVGTTGGELATFEAFAAGPEGLRAGDPYAFTTARGFDVTLTRARLYVGAVYLNATVPTSVSQDTSCFLAGTYVAEVPGGLEVDVLDGALQPFPVAGSGTTTRATTAEIWLSGGDLDAEHDPTIVAQVEGVAARGGASWPFEGSITINDNRLTAAVDPAQPGAKPICKQRVVTPIAVDLTPEEGGALVLRVDPNGWFDNVAFDELAPADTDGAVYRFRDDNDDAPSRNLYAGVRASAGVYELTWRDAPAD
jgi:hypothetical protein